MAPIAKLEPSSSYYCNCVFTPSVSPFSSRFILPGVTASTKASVSLSSVNRDALRRFENGDRVCIGEGRRRRMMVVKASLGGLLGLFKGPDTGESTRQRYASTVAKVNELEAEVAALSDEGLREKTLVLKERTSRGESLESLIPEAFAIVREASKRVLGLRPFDVQLIGNIS